MKAEPSGGAGDFKATEKHKGSLYSLLKGKRLSNPQWRPKTWNMDQGVPWNALFWKYLLLHWMRRTKREAESEKDAAGRQHSSHTELRDNMSFLNHCHYQSFGGKSSNSVLNRWGVRVMVWICWRTLLSVISFWFKQNQKRCSLMYTEQLNMCLFMNLSIYYWFFFFFYATWILSSRSFLYNVTSL